MNYKEYCTWLEGCLEGSGALENGLSSQQVKTILEKLKTVSMDASKLNHLDNPQEIVYRC